MTGINFLTQLPSLGCRLEGWRILSRATFLHCDLLCHLTPRAARPVFCCSAPARQNGIAPPSAFCAASPSYMSDASHRCAIYSNRCFHAFLGDPSDRTELSQESNPRKATNQFHPHHPSQYPASVDLPTCKRHTVKGRFYRKIYDTVTRNAS